MSYLCDDFSIPHKNTSCPQVAAQRTSRLGRRATSDADSGRHPAKTRSSAAGRPRPARRVSAGMPGGDCRSRCQHLFAPPRDRRGPPRTGERLAGEIRGTRGPSDLFARASARSRTSPCDLEQGSRTSSRSVGPGYRVLRPSPTPSALRARSVSTAGETRPCRARPDSAALHRTGALAAQAVLAPGPTPRPGSSPGGWP